MIKNAPAPSRRLLPTAVPAMGASMAIGAAAKSENGHNDGLRELGQHLERCHRERELIATFDEISEETEGRDQDLFDLSWKLREQIDGIRARTLDEVKVKVRAAQMALWSDREMACGGPGSFESLARTAMDEILAL